MKFEKNTDFYNNENTNYNLLEYYHKNAFLYISKKYPHLTNDRIKNKLKEIINEKLKSPKVKFINQKWNGDFEFNIDNLLSFTNSIKNDIITPSGAVFMKHSKKEGTFNNYIKIKKTLRADVKKNMLSLEVLGKTFEAKLKHFEQLGIKTGINSISGVMCSSVFFRSKFCYNAITSSVRYNICSAFVMTEKFLAANLYFENEDDCINYIINHLSIIPSIDATMKKYNLKIISNEDLFHYLAKCVYTKASYNKSNIDNFTLLWNYILTLSDDERSFVYYAQSISNMVKQNPKSFKDLFNYIIADIDRTGSSDIPIDDLKDTDLMTLVKIMYHEDYQGKDIKAIKADKVLLSKTKIAYLTIEKKLESLKQLYDVFFAIPISIHKPFNHANMIRKSIILSDTDSVIFTTINWMKWFTNSVAASKNNIRFNSILVYTLTKLLHHLYATTSSEVNIGKDHLFDISIKNEYFYVALLRTNISKHYLGLILIKEGQVLPTPILDFKGKNLKGSDLSTDTLKEIKAFGVWVLENLKDNLIVDYPKMVQKVMNQEYKVYNSVKKGDTDYLFKVPISRTSNESRYFYYLLWNEVFSNYDNMILPTKTYNVNIVNPITLKNCDIYLSQLKLINKGCFFRFKEFLEKYPKKKVTRLLVPVGNRIPKEIIPLIDYRKIIKSQTFAMNLILQSFNLSPPTIAKKNYLLSEIYQTKNYINIK